VKFLLNENMPPSLTGILRKSGHDAVHVREVNLKGKVDETVFNYAGEKDMIIITHDLDYSRIHAYSGKSKPSVILFRIEPLTLHRMADILQLYLKDLEKDLTQGAFVVIEEGQIRIRKLPIKNVES